MLPKGVTLRGLEVFEALAASGTVAQAAAMTGLSQPAVSQQMRNLENALGVALVDHGKRPMRLTQAGTSFLTRTKSALGQLRLAQSELTVMDLAHVGSLSMGIIDDFENDLIPRLATILAESLTNCAFKLITSPSHQLFAALQDKSLHMAVSASAGTVLDGVLEYPLARDPFILVLPSGIARNGNLTEILQSERFLRYESSQLISRQIDAHLGRQGLSFEHRFEVGSHLALMAMVAERIGWAITTPMGYMRAGRFHDQIDAFPLPFGSDARTISLYASVDWAGQVTKEVTTTMRRLLQAHMIEPALSKEPWLNGELRLLTE